MAHQAIGSYGVPGNYGQVEMPSSKCVADVAVSSAAAEIFRQRNIPPRPLRAVFQCGGVSFSRQKAEVKLIS